MSSSNQPALWKRSNLMAGVIVFNGGVDRGGGKYHVSKEEYENDTFPDYPGGWAYMLGSDLVKYLAEKAEAHGHFKINDVGVGIWLDQGIKDQEIKVVCMDLRSWALPCLHTDSIFSHMDEGIPELERCIAA